jgi:ABC-type multidrug transport system ATPase subunit
MRTNAFSKTYGNRTVLRVGPVELEPGRIHVLVGANGSGKSTFAKILSGVLKPDRRSQLSDAKTVGFMPQKNYAFRMTTKANILLNGPDEARADRLMEAIQLTELSSKRADKLSGGETARMALVRLMMRSYDLVILDEPTAAMDMETTLLSEKLIVEYVRETGCALILVTHSLQQARRIADEVWYFHKGSLLETGAKEQVLDTPERAETKQFLEFYGV